jgi:hypothetical protein
LTIADIGLDHFLLDRNIDATTVGLVAALIKWNEQRPPQVVPIAVQ